MNTNDLLKTYREQTFATTILFVAVALFGLVFWRLFASQSPYILEVEKNAMESRVTPSGPAISLDR